MSKSKPCPVGETIRLRGLVQGVGLRPTVWRLAKECGLWGEVRNDSEGVLIRAWGQVEALEAFVRKLKSQAPPLARIDTVERQPLEITPPNSEFRIFHSSQGEVRTGVMPDAAVCASCLTEIFDPTRRRYRYPFTNCTHCGPRFSIIAEIPYDRSNTSMAPFAMCPACQAEYEDPNDRRFHAQPNACPLCGPQVWLEDATAQEIPPTALGCADPIAAAAQLLLKGAIMAIKGLGGFHLACDGTQFEAVARLRSNKRRYEKPLALMARDLEMIRRYCQVTEEAAQLLQSPAAPIVLLPREGKGRVAENVAPEQQYLGFMLPYTPLHHLLCAELDQPLVMTSGNLSEEPPCLHNPVARSKLAGIADYFLLHNRDIINRVDDSVVRIMAGRPRWLRRARGYAPAPLALPPGFEAAPPLLALGGELKNTFCLLKGGQCLPSQHLGDLEEAKTFADYQQNLSLYRRLYQQTPKMLVVDRHPEYLSAKLGREWAAREGLPLLEVQHHHAHIASCMAENGLPLETSPVLGVALDGLGYGEGGTLWGGEFLRADYRSFERLATFKPAPLIGGVQAIREPWRSTYAHILTGLGWDRFQEEYGALELFQYLNTKPLATLNAMVKRGLNCPQTSSCGRLFDGVAAALGGHRGKVSFEGQAAMALETWAEAGWPQKDRCLPYPFALSMGDNSRLPWIDPTPLWQRLLDDLNRGESREKMAVCFHLGLVEVLVAMVRHLGKAQGMGTVALSGGVFQNRLLLEGMISRLEAEGLTVLSHRYLPTNDGGLSVGQAVVGAAWALGG
ncbi:carbamoyltransferase HypF [Nitrosococcus halophilus]|uniref:carbamoyltransferase HypF n=1 Tax=Nitrosococcus halophilus TaxID=133539 RepID=UPI001EF0C195|nr:carbamoyltransferase HypF [Nitrosococcus halophilus]